MIDGHEKMILHMEKDSEEQGFLSPNLDISKQLLSESFWGEMNESLRGKDSEGESIFRTFYFVKCSCSIDKTLMVGDFC